ncbi:kanadaptin [Lepeophtheirus salmonis]|uniref:kanadaptin n=1 Tax=Lepeophtheirus salmonis TaxID=72036 RepID=UPI001AE7F2CB|nr:kanadaptin-like [Lepeophtheirus salmonis]
MDSTNEDEFKAPLRSGPPVIKEGPIADLNYEEPEWSGTPPSDSKLKYELEVLKNGVIIETYPLTGKNFFVLGRLPTVDISQEHPSLSRHHAIIQFRPGAGFFLFDLESAHGTFHNKRRVIPRTFIPLRVGHSIKLGGSSRLLLLKGPDEDSEPEGSMEAVKELLQKKKLEKLEEKENPEGISWGMREDAVDDNDVNPFATEEEGPPLDLDDPKKTLKNWFEREGYELDYKVEEKGHSNFLCSVDIPTDTGEPLIAEVKAGKKKEAIIQCALEACKLLDRRGILRASSASSKRKSTSKNWEEMDYYDSDDDEFLDRTGNIQEKRIKRMKLAKKSQDTVETYDSLKKKLATVEIEKSKVQTELEKSKASIGADDMDDYVNSLNGGAVDKHTINKLKTKFNELKRESLRLDKLIELTKPSNMVSSVSKPSEKKVFSGGVMIGKRFGGGIFGKTRMIPKLSPKVDEKAKVESKEKIADKNEAQKEDAKSEPLENSFEPTEKPPKSLEKEKFSNKDSENPNASIDRKNEEIKSKSIPSHSSEPAVEEPQKVLEKIQPKKKKREESNKKDPKKQTLPDICDEGKIEGNYSSSLSDPKYATWVPPDNQTGDGRTSLNDKFGY